MTRKFDAAPVHDRGGTTAGQAGIRVAQRRTATAFVSLYAPVGRRRWWWYSYRCAVCERYQLGRAPSLEDVAGIRTAGCGHKVTIAIARIYGRSAA